jgi:DAK2 domain fusion protein YloV
VERLGADALRATITCFRDTLRDHARELDRLNVYPVPDGDTGTNMARTLEAVVVEMDAAPAELTATCRAVAHGSLMGARGNSGVILSQILRGMTNAFEQAVDVGPRALATALTSASSAAYEAVLRPMEGTILTVVREAAAAASLAAGAGATLSDVLSAANRRAREALQHTPELLPVLKEAGVVDAGGAGFVLLLDAALHVVDGRPLPVAPVADEAAVEPSSEPASAPRSAGASAAGDLRYEVMFFLDLADADIGRFKQAWGDIGDSIVVVGGDGLWNCHIHTHDIGAAIESALAVGGRPRQIRVTDLHEQSVAEDAAREEAERRSRTCGVVAVAAGAGLRDLLGRLGVQEIVAGGQTMNPSTAELLDAVERVAAPQVILLPANRNIVPVAEQAAAVSGKEARVVPACSIPETLAALVAYDPDLGAGENAGRMAEAMAGVAAAEVTRAVRAASSPAGAVHAGDWIGLIQGIGIVAVAPSAVKAAIATLDRLVADGCELVTIIRGADAGPDEVDALRDWLRASRPDVEVDVQDGGQPLYPFLIGAE